MELERRAFIRLFEKASQARFQTRVSLATLRVDWSGQCSAPVPVEWHSYSGKSRTRTRLVGPGAASFNRIEAMVPCRRCENCRKRRTMIWSARAIAEWRGSARTWAAALTFRPEVHHWCLSLVRRRISEQGLDFDALAVDDRFSELHKVLSKEVTRFIKRVRFNTGAPLRYMEVVEAHKSGLPHYHVLLHEQRAEKPVSKRTLEQAWRAGHSHWRLVRCEAQCAYLAKYIGKDNASRIRASLNYGVCGDTGEDNLQSRNIYDLPPTFFLDKDGEGTRGTDLDIQSCNGVD